MGIAHSQQSSVGIGLIISDSQGPLISLIDPINSSGNTIENITFFYNVTDANNVDNCSLIINNEINLTDVSITEDTKISFILNHTSLGSYNWSINCTDNSGYVGISDNRTVTVIFMINFNGSTTNISLVNVKNVTKFVLERTDSGKINFSEGVDLSQGLDLDKYINISQNRIKLNSTALNELNKSATLYLYGLTFSNPRVLRDGSVCPSSICTELPYSGSIFAFNVTQFTVYSSEETPSSGGETQTTTGGGGGGGGGGGAGGGAIRAEFTIDKETLKVILKQGQKIEHSLKIKNTGDTTIIVTTNFKALKRFVYSPSLDEIAITLNPGEEHTINVVFGAEEDQKPDVYTGEITVKSGSVEKVISTIIEVESAKPLFDVDVEVLPEYKSVYPGDEVFMEVSLFNVRGFGRVDVNLEYSIRDFKGNLIVAEHETVAVEMQAKFGRELLIPSDLEPGMYVASVKVTFEDSVGISSDLFEVKAKAIKLYPIAIKDYTFYLLLGTVLIAGIAIFFMRGFYFPKKGMPKTKKEGIELIKEEKKIQKLEKELKALEQAYNSKFISEESYNKNKKRIEKELEKLKE